MAKMSQEMYGASGKLGNKVYFKGVNGQTIVREKVTPKNPKTNAQTIQRVLVSQVGLTYKAFKEICDHSFETVNSTLSHIRAVRAMCDRCEPVAGGILHFNP